MRPLTPEEEPGNGLTGDNRGRRPKLDAMVRHALKTMLEAGATPAAAAPAAGITYQTFCNWMEWGSQSRRGVYSDFFKEMSVAMATNRVMVEAEIRKEKPLDYAKHVWRKEPEWAPLQDKVEISGTLTHEVDAELEAVFGAIVNAEIAARTKPEIEE